MRSRGNLMPESPTARCLVCSPARRRKSYANRCNALQRRTGWPVTGSPAFLSGESLSGSAPGPGLGRRLCPGSLGPGVQRIFSASAEPRRMARPARQSRCSPRVEHAKGTKMEKALPSIAHLFLRPARPKPPADSEAASGMLAVSMVLPEQFYNLPDNTYKVRSEVALMYAVLDDAVRCFQRQT